MKNEQYLVLTDESIAASSRVGFGEVPHAIEHAWVPNRTQTDGEDAFFAVQAVVTLPDGTLKLPE